MVAPAVAHQSIVRVSNVNILRKMTATTATAITKPMRNFLGFAAVLGVTAGGTACGIAATGVPHDGQNLPASVMAAPSLLQNTVVNRVNFPLRSDPQYEKGE
jgi:hypothetical protein